MWLLRSNSYMAIMAALLALGVGVQLDTDYSVWYAALVGFSTAFGYTMMRLLKFSGSTTNPQATRWKAGQKWSTFQLLVSGGAIAYILLFSPWQLPDSLVIWLAFALSVLYALPFIPTSGKRLALRDLPFIKPFVVAAVWAYVVFGLNSKSGAYELMWIGFFYFLGLALLFDVRDMKTDTMHTWPRRLGWRTTKWLALLLVTAALGGFYWYELWSGAIALTVWCVHLCAIMLVHPQRSYDYYEWVLDGCLGLLGLALLLQ
jgi:hypothetical protein